MANRFEELFKKQQQEEQGIPDDFSSSLEPLSSSSVAVKPNRFRDLFESSSSSAEVPPGSSLTEPSARELPPVPEPPPTLSPESGMVIKKIPEANQDITATVKKKETLIPNIEITADVDITKADNFLINALGQDVFDKILNPATRGQAERALQDKTGKDVNGKAAKKFLKFRQAIADIRINAGDPKSANGKILMGFLNRRTATKGVLKETSFDPEEPGAKTAAALFPRVARGEQKGANVIEQSFRGIIDAITIPGAIVGAAAGELAEGIAGTGELPGATTFREKMAIRGTPAEPPGGQLFASPVNPVAAVTGPLLRGAGKLAGIAGAEKTGLFLERSGSLGRARSRVDKLKLQMAESEASEVTISALEKAKRSAVTAAGKTGEFATASSIPTLAELADANLTGRELLPAQGAYMLIAGMVGEGIARSVFSTVDPQVFIRNLGGRTKEIAATLELLASNKNQFDKVKKLNLLPSKVFTKQLKEAAKQMKIALKKAGIEVGEAKEGELGKLIDVTSIIDEIDNILNSSSFTPEAVNLSRRLESTRERILGNRNLRRESDFPPSRAKRGGKGLEDVEQIIPTKETFFLPLKDVDLLKRQLGESGDPKVSIPRADQAMFNKLAGISKDLVESAFNSKVRQDNFISKKQNFAEIKKNLDRMKMIIGGNILDIEGKAAAFSKNMFDVEVKKRGKGIRVLKEDKAQNLQLFSDLEKQIRVMGLQKEIDNIRSGKFLAKSRANIAKKLKKDINAIRKIERLRPLPGARSIRKAAFRQKAKEDIAKFKDPNFFNKTKEISKIQKQIDKINSEPGLFENAITSEFAQRMVEGFPRSERKDFTGPVGAIISKFRNLFLIPSAIVADRTGLGIRPQAALNLSKIVGHEISEETLKRAIPNAIMRKVAVEIFIWQEISAEKQKEQTPETIQKIQALQNESIIFNTFGSEDDLPEQFREFIDMPQDEDENLLTDAGQFLSKAKKTVVKKGSEVIDVLTGETNGKIPNKLNGFGPDLNDFFPKAKDSGLTPENIVSFINVAAEKNHDNPHTNLDEFKLLAQSVASRESAGNVRAQSSAGARGLMQIMDQTAKDHDVSPRDIFDIDKNVDVGTRLLNKLLIVYKGSKEKALAAYNGGEPRVNEAVRLGGEQWRDHLAPDNPKAKAEMNDFVDAVIGKFNSKADLLTASVQ